MLTSTPNISDFDPSIIPFQLKVLKDLASFDYEKGTYEILLSGSVGCLREDALISTIFGKVPIGDIKKQDYLLTYHEKSNQFGITQGSGAYPKGRGNLYRVISAHEEFVANENHLIATSHNKYERICDLFSRGSSFVAPYIQHQTNQEFYQKAFVLCVLNYFETILNLINHCVIRIHQCGQQLPQQLKIFLDDFPLLNDVQEFGLFFYSHKSVPVDDLLVPAPTHDHISGLPFRLSMQDFFHILENMPLGEEGVCIQSDSKSYEHILGSNLIRMLCQTQTGHPKDVLYFLSKFCFLLYSSFIPPSISITNTTYKLERLTSNDWYWDMKIPNTNNYLSHGLIHHNSAKTLLMAHIAVLYCLKYPNNTGLLGRKSIGDLRDTLLLKILDHMEGVLVEGEDYDFHRANLMITFKNNSKLICRSWADKRYTKMRSLDLSFALIEEVTENNSEEFKSFYKEVYGRIGRLSHIKEKFIIGATNPDSPAHAAHEYFIESKNPNRKVYYSLTKDNPFLPKAYIEGLRNTLTAQEARRMLEGEWVEIRREFVYYAFTDERNVKKPFLPNLAFPIAISFDFNISAKKPMSVTLSQYYNGNFYYFDEVVIFSSNTRDVCDELIARGTMDLNTRFIIRGDASGRAQSSKFNQSDYDIIENILSNYVTKDGRRTNVVIDVPLSNPPVRKRHVLVNGQLLNANNETHLFVSENCTMTIKGLRLTKMKEGAGYIEDDNDPWQHVTTALGYNVVRELENTETLYNFNQGTIHGDKVTERKRFARY